jgi:hypothetical protein
MARFRFADSAISTARRSDNSTGSAETAKLAAVESIATKTAMRAIPAIYTWAPTGKRPLRSSNDHGLVPLNDAWAVPVDVPVKVQDDGDVVVKVVEVTLIFKLLQETVVAPGEVFAGKTAAEPSEAIVTGPKDLALTFMVLGTVPVQVKGDSVPEKLLLLSIVPIQVPVHENDDSTPMPAVMVPVIELVPCQLAAKDVGVGVLVPLLLVLPAATAAAATTPPTTATVPMPTAPATPAAPAVPPAPPATAPAAAPTATEPRPLNAAAAAAGSAMAGIATARTVAALIAPNVPAPKVTVPAALVASISPWSTLK